MVVSQSDLADVNFGGLKLQQDAYFQGVSNAINELGVSQSNLVDVKFGDLKLQHDASFQEVSNALTGLNELISGLLKQQNSLESALILAQEERLSIRKISISNLILSITSVTFLAGILFVLLK